VSHLSEVYDSNVLIIGTTGVGKSFMVANSEHVPLSSLDDMMAGTWEDDVVRQMNSSQYDLRGNYLQHQSVELVVPPVAPKIVATLHNWSTTGTLVNVSDSYHCVMPPTKFVINMIPGLRSECMKSLTTILNKYRYKCMNYMEHPMCPALFDDDYGYYWTGSYWEPRVNDGTNPALFNIHHRSRAFFRGAGNALASRAANFGLCRQKNQLLYQKRRKERTGVGTSGHLISSVLLPAPHFLWLLHEMAFNYSTKQSVYLLPFSGQVEGEYHTYEEYVNGVEDLKEAARRNELDGTIVERMEFLKYFLSFLRRPPDELDSPLFAS